MNAHDPNVAMLELVAEHLGERFRLHSVELASP
jgi:hypothetical protein